jgi:hypothetical protein
MWDQYELASRNTARRFCFRDPVLPGLMAIGGKRQSKTGQMSLSPLDELATIKHLGTILPAHEAVSLRGFRR